MQVIPNHTVPYAAAAHCFKPIFILVPSFPFSSFFLSTLSLILNLRPMLDRALYRSPSVCRLLLLHFTDGIYIQSESVASQPVFQSGARLLAGSGSPLWPLGQATHRAAMTSPGIHSHGHTGTPRAHTHTPTHTHTRARAWRRSVCAPGKLGSERACNAIRAETDDHYTLIDI